MKINIVQDIVYIYQLKRKFEKVPPLLIFDHNFQTFKKNWNSKQKSELIESILMGVPLPVIYVKEDNNGGYIIVDGRQRLTAIFEFMNDKFNLMSLKILDSLNGKFFRDTDLKQQNKIENCSLILHVIKPHKNNNILKNIINRLTKRINND